MEDSQVIQTEQLPSGWIEVPLSDITILIESGSRPRGGVKSIREGIVSIGGEHLNALGGFDFSKIKYVPHSFASQMNKGQIKENDILIVKDGATTGKVSIIDHLFPFPNAVVNEHVFICRLPVEINPFFVFWFLWSNEGQKRILANFKGSAQGGINLSFSRNTLVPIAPNLEQERIVSNIKTKMEELEHLRKVLDEIPLLLKIYRQTVLNAATAGKLTENWRDIQKENYNSDILLVQIANHRAKVNAKTKKSFSRNGPLTLPEYFEEVPKTWTWTYLFNIGEIASGVMKGRNLSNLQTITVPYLRVANVQDGYLDLTEVKSIQVTLEDQDKYQLKYGDLLFTEGGDRDKLGRGAIWREEIPNCLHQNHIFRCRLIEEYTKREFVLAFTRSESARRYFYDNASQTVNLASINMSVLGSLPVPIPPYEEQEEIIRQINDLFQLADSLEEDYAEAQVLIKELPQLLLEQAFSGKLTHQDPNDEPASVLMEKIRAQLEVLREKLQTATKQKRDMAKTQKNKSKNLEEAIHQSLLGGTFTFEELAIALADWNYEELKNNVFKLLNDGKMVMNFDQSKKVLTFKMAGHDN